MTTTQTIYRLSEYKTAFRSAILQSIETHRPVDLTVRIADGDGAPARWEDGLYAVAREFSSPHLIEHGGDYPRHYLSAERRVNGYDNPPAPEIDECQYWLVRYRWVRSARPGDITTSEIVVA